MRSRGHDAHIREVGRAVNRKPSVEANLIECLGNALQMASLERDELYDLALHLHNLSVGKGARGIAWRCGICVLVRHFLRLQRLHR